MFNQLFRTYSIHFSKLIKLGMPIVIGQIGIIILGFADTFMVGRFSTDALGAASFVNNLFALIIIAGTGFSYGLTPIVGQHLGQGNTLGIARALKNSLLANTCVTVIFSVAMYIVYVFIDQLDQPPELLPIIRPYYLVILSSLIFVMLFNAFKQFADGIMDTHTSMWILLFGNCLNILLNYLFIYGKCGFTQFGLLGAGIATLIARIAMLAIFIVVFFLRYRYRPYLESFMRTSIDRCYFIKLNVIGWPLALQMGMETAAFCLTTVMIGWLGTYALAAHQIMMTISTLFFFIYYGIGSALAIQVSYYNGKNNWLEIKHSTIATFILMGLIAIIAWAIFWPFRMQICLLFTNNAQVTDLLEVIFPIMLIYQFGDCLQITLSNALRAIMDVKFLMIVSFFTYFILSLSASYFFGIYLNWAIAGIWIAFPIGLTSAGICFLWRFYKNVQQGLKKQSIDLNSI